MATEELRTASAASLDDAIRTAADALRVDLVPVASDDLAEEAAALSPAAAWLARQVVRALRQAECQESAAGETFERRLRLASAAGGILTGCKFLVRDPEPDAEGLAKSEEPTDNRFCEPDGRE